MRGTKISMRPRAGRKSFLTLAALPALTLLLLLTAPSPIKAQQPSPAGQPLKEAIDAGGSKTARFVLRDGRTLVGRIIRIDQNALIIRRPSAGRMSLPLNDIVGINIKSAKGELLSGQLTRMSDGGLGWLADSDGAEAKNIAVLEAGSSSDIGGPLVRLDTPIDDEEVDDQEVKGGEVNDEDVDGEVADVELAKLAPPDAPAPDAGQSPETQPVRLVVTTEEAVESEKLIEFRLTLSEPATRSILIIFTMIDGTAAAPDDYTHSQGVVTFEPGQTEAVVSTPIIDDETAEDAETFTFFVTADPNLVVVEKREIAATIADDDR